MAPLVDNAALLVIDAQQEYFAPLGKVVLPAGPAGEPVLTKHLPGAFTGTSLEEILRAGGVQRLIVSGFMTQMCVDTTTRQAAHRGFQVTVLSDATAAMAVKDLAGQVIPADAVHQTHLGSLSDFLAEIKLTAAITRAS